MSRIRPGIAPHVRRRAARAPALERAPARCLASSAASPAPSRSTSRSSPPPWTPSPRPTWRSPWRAPGGIGVLHKNMSIDRQAAEVDRVKRSESGMIMNPITLGADRPLREAARAHAAVPDLGRADRGRRGPADRHHHQPRPAVRAEPRPADPRGDDQGTPGHGAGGHHASTRPSGSWPSTGSRSSRWWMASGVLRGLITVKDIFKRREHPDANKDQHGRLRVAAARGRRARGARPAPRRWSARAWTCSSSTRRTATAMACSARSTRSGRAFPTCSWWPATSPPRTARGSWCAAAWTP